MKHTLTLLILAATLTPSVSLCMRSSKVALALESKPPVCQAVLCLSYVAWLEAHLLSHNEKLISRELRLCRDLLEKKVEPVAFHEWRIEFLKATLADNKHQWEQASATYLNALLYKDEQKHD